MHIRITPVYLLTSLRKQEKLPCSLILLNFDNSQSCSLLRPTLYINLLALLSTAPNMFFILTEVSLNANLAVTSILLSEMKCPS